MKQLIQQLIQIESVSGREQRISQFVAGFLRNLKLKPVVIDGNIICQIIGEDKTKLMVFNAHLDTVGPGNLSDWKYPPYCSKSGVINRGKIYGLGASDEKAGIAALLLLAKQFKITKPPIDVVLMFVVGEEIDGRGTKNVLKHFGECGLFNQYSYVSGVICEPTGLKEIQIAHKGNVFIKLTSRGDAGHGSEPEKIKSQAIKLLLETIVRIEKLGKKWCKKYDDNLLGKPTVSLTSLQAGDLNCPNSFPSVAQATFDVRTIPQMHQLVVGSIKRIVKRTGIEVSTVGDPAAAGYTDPDDPLIKAAKLTFPGAKVATSAGSTDQCFFSELNIPAIIFGPGEENMAHKPNEYCYLAKIDKCVSLYEKLIFTWINLVGKIRENGNNSGSI